MLSTVQFQLLLGSHARLEQSEEGFHISTGRREFRFRVPVPELAGAVRKLVNGGVTEDSLFEEAMKSGEASWLYSLIGVLRSLDAGGALLRRLVLHGTNLATLIPKTDHFQFLSNARVSQGQRKLSRFAYLRMEGGTLVMESPLGWARVEIHDARAASAVLALAHPRSLDELECLFPDLAHGPLEGLLILLDNAAAFTDDDDATTAWWEFHDLLFHMRSRRGRDGAGYGGTYRHGKAVPPPLIKPRQPGEVIPLLKPDLQELCRTDPPLADVMERRRSIRTYGSEPITTEQLGEFLYRSARYQRVMCAETTQFALRPAPAGGAIHELEIYALVAQCRGLNPGVYHYRPAEHELTRIASTSPAFDALTHQAWVTADRKSPLNILFQITARCRRVFWKYESMAYALILKNVGALYATMYLVATAMDLAPCALGGGDSELFAAIAGLNPCDEPSVGEFILGSRERS
jgi:SagB-type dehydrogenase family enzyme